ncbi:Zinc finger MYM-type protein 6 [Labeo rohita]|uniref:Zinc finger MYM-type protein 6 n=1 Tax=Labeo rohita TaxID=84645 RepID=A0ABQ8MMT0_LABRO|nr:Zinc finger MYM-type protein 6 [Labeo rohita]
MPWYALQADGSTDLDNNAILLVYTMCICSLPTNTTGAEIFKSLNDYLSSKLNWSFSVGICTEGAVSMTGRPSHNPGQEVVPEWESTHCVINWEMLARCKMSPELHSLQMPSPPVFSNSVAKKWKPVATHPSQVAFKGEILSKSLQVKKADFFQKKKSPLAAHFSDEEWIENDNCFQIGRQNVCIQSQLATVGQQLTKDTFDMFPTLPEHLGNKDPGPSLSQLICDHIALLSVEFEHYLST